MKTQMNMKTRTWKTAALLSMAVAALTACKDDDDTYYINGNAWVSYGDLEQIDQNGHSRFAIRRDDGARLIVSDGLSIPSDASREGARVYPYYAVLGSERDEAGLEGRMNYYIRLYDLRSVLTKNPVKESFIRADEAHRQDSLGADPVHVSAAWFGGKYLNVEFMLPVKAGSDTKHFINVVEDDVTAHNDTVYITLRHNAYGDTPRLTESGTKAVSVHGDNVRWMWGNASFDLTSILPAGKTSVPVKFLWTGYKADSWTTEVMSDSGLYAPAIRTKVLRGGGLNSGQPDPVPSAHANEQLQCK